MASRISKCYAECRSNFRSCGESEQCKAAFVRCIDLCGTRLLDTLLAEDLTMSERDLVETLQDMQEMMELKTLWYEELLQKMNATINIFHYMNEKES